LRSHVTGSPCWQVQIWWRNSERGSQVLRLICAPLVDPERLPHVVAGNRWPSCLLSSPNVAFRKHYSGVVIARQYFVKSRICEAAFRGTEYYCFMEMPVATKNRGVCPGCVCLGHSR